MLKNSLSKCLRHSSRSAENEKILARMRELDDLIMQYECHCQLTKNRYLTLLKVKEDFEREKEELMLIFHERR